MGNSRSAMTKSYVYAKLPAVKNNGFFRIGGNGLANCMFVAARAFVIARKRDLDIIEPTWLNFSIGPYLRRQEDKRHYSGIFKTYGKNAGLRKFFLLSAKKAVNAETTTDFDSINTVFEVNGLGNYFEDILDDHQALHAYFDTIIRPGIKKPVDAFDFKKTVAVHIRLGDYPENLRLPIEWYLGIIGLINEITQGSYRILIFSDGTDEELSAILAVPNVEKAFFGNAISDIVAISRTDFLVGSDSTFSGWGAYLGQVPSLFGKKHYGRVLQDQSKEMTTSAIDEEVKDFIALILKP